MTTVVRSLTPLNDHEVLVLTRRGELRIHSIETGKKLSRNWQPSYRAMDAFYLNPVSQLTFFNHLGDDAFQAYSLQDARIQWKVKLPDINPGGSFFQDMLFVRQAETRILGIDIATGEVRLTRPLGTPLKVGPVVSANRLWVITNQGLVLGYDSLLQDPRKLQLELEPLPKMSSSGKWLAVADSKGRVVFIDGDSARVRWSVSLKASVFGQPIITPSGILVGLSNGDVRFLDIESGNVLWGYTGTGLIHSEIAVIGDRAVIPFLRGRVVILDLKNGQALQLINVPGILHAWAATSHGLLVAHSPRHLSYYGVTGE